MEDSELGNITRIRKRHERRRFRSDNTPLDEWFARYACQADQKGTIRVFVAEAADDPNWLLGFYALSAGEILVDHLAAQQRYRLPNYPVPIVRLTRLAVEEARQGQGLGGMLLVDALRRSVNVAEQLGTLAVIVDAKDAAATRFYEHYGFEPLSDDPPRLFLPIDTIRDL